MTEDFRTHLRKTLAEIDAAGLYKRERVLTTPQRARVGYRELEGPEKGAMELRREPDDGHYL